MNDKVIVSPFFIIGASRSGTTMFRLMLNRHSQLYVPNESWFLIPLMNELPIGIPLNKSQLEHASDIMIPFMEKRDWNIKKSELLTIGNKLVNPTLADYIDSVYKYLGNNLSWGDKTPGYLTEIKRLHNLFPKAKFIHIIRDGRDVCVSLRNTGWHGDVTWSIADYWSKSVATGCNTGRALPDDLYFEINYDDLVLNTEYVLKNVCNFLGIDFESNMLNFYEDANKHIAKNAPHEFHTKIKRKPQKNDTQRWTNEMSKTHLAIFESIAGDTMKLANQKPYYASWQRKPLGMAVSIVNWVAEFTLPLRNKIGLHFPTLRKRF